MSLRAWDDKRTPASLPRRRLSFLGNDAGAIDQLRVWKLKRLLEEIRHIRSCRRRSGVGRYAEGVEYGAQCVLVAIGQRRLEMLLYPGPHDRGVDLFIARADGGIAFIEGNNHQSVATRLEGWVVQKRSHIALQPGIGLGQRAVVRVVIDVRNDDGVRRKLIGSEVLGKLRERNHVLLQGRTVDDIGVPAGGIVAHNVRAGIGAHVAGRWQSFRVYPPRQPGARQLAEDVVVRDGRRASPALTAESV